MIGNVPLIGNLAVIGMVLCSEKSDRHVLVMGNMIVIGNVPVFGTVPVIGRCL